MVPILCPHCQTRFATDLAALGDRASFVCPACQAEITVHLRWRLPPKMAQAA